MSPLRLFFAAWFGNFRFKEFGAIVMAALALGHEVASQVGAEGEKATKIAVAFGVVAAVCYILNPKYAEWVKVTPQPAPAAAPGDVPELADPMDEAHDTDPQLALPIYNDIYQNSRPLTGMYTNSKEAN